MAKELKICVLKSSPKKLKSVNFLKMDISFNFENRLLKLSVAIIDMLIIDMVEGTVCQFFFIKALYSLFYVTSKMMPTIFRKCFPFFDIK